MSLTTFLAMLKPMGVIGLPSGSVTPEQEVLQVEETTGENALHERAQVTFWSVLTY